MTTFTQKTHRSVVDTATVRLMRSTLFFICVCLLLTSTRAHFLTPRSDTHILKPRSEPATKSCKIHQKPSLHQAMDRICEMCHEMFSHEKPNMRSECRSKCFRNDQFRDCLEVFSGMPAIAEDSRM